MQMMKEMDEVRRVPAEKLDTLNREEVGQLVLCEIRDISGRRMYLHRFSSWERLTHKNGLLDTFTLSEKPCDVTGFYLCRISRFRMDRNGFLNMMVEPLRHLPDAINQYSDVFRYFWSYGLLREQSYFDSEYQTRGNVTALCNLFKTEIDALENKENSGLKKQAAALILSKLIEGTITCEEIVQALDSKSKMELLADDFIGQISVSGFTEKNKYAADAPRFVQKLQSRMATDEYLSSKLILDYLERKNQEYHSLQLGNETDTLKRVEAVFSYWEDKKAKEKAEKKNRRKLKKVNPILSSGV